METRFVTTELLGSGFAAVCYWLNTEDFPDDTFWEPWQTGIGRYTTEGEAADEAQNWAFCEELAYVVATDTGTHCTDILNQWRAEQLASG